MAHFRMRTSPQARIIGSAMAVIRPPSPRLQGYQAATTGARGASLLSVILLYASTRLALYGLVAASFVWPRTGAQPLASVSLNRLEPVVMANPAPLRPFAQWDGVHYLNIAAQGYAWARNAGFFPLYPLLMHVLAFGQSRLILAGLAVNAAAAGIAVVLLARLISIDYPEAAWPAAVLLLLYPGALFLSVVYAEALALLFFVAAAYAARRRRWWLAGAVGALAALVRPTGVLIALLVVTEYVLHERPWRRITLVALALPVAGLGAYAVYLWRAIGDPLAFGPQGHVAERRLLALPVEFTNGHFFTSPSVWVWLVAFALAVWAMVALRPSYGIFAAALVLAGPLTGSFGSSIRYAAVAWPLFAVAGRYLRYEPALLAVGACLALGLAFFIVLFTHGYFVA
jgi:hypothetical protein